MKKWRRTFSSLVASLAILLTALSLPAGTFRVAAANNETTIQLPGDTWGDPGTSYPRVIQIRYGGANNGTLLATCEKYDGASQPSFPIYRSTDDGKTWSTVSYVTSSPTGMRWEPTLFELPQAVGSLSAGTILCAGLSIDSTYTYGTLKLFKSTDCGATWTFMSTIAQGGAANHGIWEPALAIDSNGRLVCYYADERQHETYSQKIVHQVSTDGGLTWGAVVNDVALSNSSLRPGMPTVTKMGNGQYFMTYEIVGESGNPVYYRTSTNGVNWGTPTNAGTKLTSVDGVTPGSSPFVVWTPSGGTNGTLIVSGMFQTPSSSRGSDYFVNYNYGTGSWYRIQQPLAYTYSSSQMTGYSHSMFVSATGNELYHVNTTNYVNNKSKLVFEKTTLSLASGYTYKIINKNSGLVLSANNASPVAGASMVQSADLDRDGQIWYITDAGNGYYRIVNQHSALALSIGGAALGDGAEAVQWGDYGGNEQLWQIALQSDGFYKITNKNSSKVLEIPSNSTAEGTHADQRTDSQLSGQRWRLVCVNTLFDKAASYTIQSKYSGKPLLIDQASLDDNANVIQWSVDNTPVYSWSILPVYPGGGYYKIVNNNSKKALAVQNASTSSGANIVQVTYTGANEQQWYMLYAGSGQYRIINKNSGLYLDMSSLSNGAVAKQYASSDSDTQLWSIAKQTAEFQASYFYQIINKNSLLPLSVQNASTANGAIAVQASSSGGNEQKWNIISAGNGYYRIMNQNSSRALSIGGAYLGDYGEAIQWDYYGGDEQLWSFVRQSDGFYQIVNKNSGKALEIAGGSTQSGAAADQLTDTGAACQRWQIVFAGMAFDANTNYTLSPKNSGLLLSVSGASTANGANVVQWGSTNGNEQAWKLQYVSDGYYKILNVNSNRALSVGGADTLNGAQTIQWDYYGGNEQLWRIVYLENGYYVLINKNSGKNLHVSGNSLNNGATIDQWTGSAESSQLWQIAVK